MSPLDSITNVSSDRPMYFNNLLTSDSDWNLELIDGRGGALFGNGGPNVFDLSDVQITGVYGVFGRNGDDTIIASRHSRTAYYGEEGNDTIQGQGQGESIYAGDGDDTIKGGGGDDYLVPGSGIDIVDAGGGNDSIGVQGDWSEFDTLKGGNGFDTVRNLWSSVDVKLNQFLSDNNDWNLEAVEGLNRSIVGNEGSNLFDFRDVQISRVASIDTAGGNDTILASAATANVIYRGGSGDDTLTGFGKRDLLFGDDGNDTLIGGGGDDELNGGNGINVLTGDGGNDRFIVEAESTNRITDFDRRGNDVIQILAAPPEAGQSPVDAFFATDADLDGDEDDLLAELWSGITIELLDEAVRSLDDSDFEIA